MLTNISATIPYHTLPIRSAINYEEGRGTWFVYLWHTFFTFSDCWHLAHSDGLAPCGQVLSPLSRWVSEADKVPREILSRCRCRSQIHWHVIVFAKHKRKEHAKHLIAVQIFAEKCFKISQFWHCTYLIICYEGRDKGGWFPKCNMLLTGIDGCILSTCLRQAGSRGIKTVRESDPVTGEAASLLYEGNAIQLPTRTTHCLPTDRHRVSTHLHFVTPSDAFGQQSVNWSLCRSAVNCMACQLFNCHAHQLCLWVASFRTLCCLFHLLALLAGQELLALAPLNRKFGPIPDGTRCQNACLKCTLGPLFALISFNGLAFH